MKKQQLIHLHGFLNYVRDEYEKNFGNSVENEQYFELGVAPTSIHRSKTDHSDAVLALAEGMAQEVEDPGSTYADLESLEEPVMRVAAHKYDNKNSEKLLVSQGEIPLSEKQTDRLVENSQIEYIERTYGSDRLHVPHSEVEKWADETCRELG